MKNWELLTTAFPRQTLHCVCPQFRLTSGCASSWPTHCSGKCTAIWNMATSSSPLRIGVVGYGHLGQYLVEKICTDGAARGFTLAFVWNRNPAKLKGLVPDELILTDLSAFAERQCDVIVEVCHPQIVKEFGPHFLSQSHFMALFIRMSKHPSCFRLTGDLLSDWAEGEGRRVLFKGSVAELCPLAPNNVNTMAAAAVAAGTLGFTGVQGEIVSDTALSDYHVVEVEVTGPDGFSVHTVRRNPAKLGAVTGSATYSSFWNSLLLCKGHGGRIYLC
ncbi:aspartate dehydrogenase domain-containing protein isoform X2 [Channa argus]|uniref:aspartate dehydrogenase domain-containing protein isoform X2 n=1 Tax=Channa argus TaxID=215402 RepID=UPI0035229E8E